jgi:BRO1-like domain/ALIX V-shaped domain binding to HIV/UBA/TS-N domain
MLQTLLLPLRVPEPCEIHHQLAVWLENEDGDDHSEQNPRPDFLPAECEADFRYLKATRQHLEDRILVDYETSYANLGVLQEYAAALGEFCARGFPSTDLEGEGLTLSWRENSHTGSPVLILHTQASSETHHSLAWERANVLYNIAVTLTYAAYAQQHQQQDSSSLDDANAASSGSGGGSGRHSWNKLGLYLQQAATVVQYIREDVLSQTGNLHSSLALSNSFLQVWETFLLAEAQRAAYQTFVLQRAGAAATAPSSRRSPSRHLMLAKLAAAAAPLYQAVEDLCAADARFGQCDLILDWEDSVRAWGMWMTAVTEYHQSGVHRENEEWGLELARLEGALKFGSFCREFCESCENTDLLDGLVTLQVLPVLKEVDERLEEAERDNETTHHQDVPEHDELPDIVPQQTVKTDMANISKLLPALSKPLFAGVMDPTVRKYNDAFRNAIKTLVAETERLADERTESARHALAVVNLPHSLTVYQQERNGGGIPDEIWERVEELQAERGMDRLHEDLWKVRGYADTARTTFANIEEQMENDVESDEIFRRSNPHFEGHDVGDIQASFRQAVSNYQRLMDSAAESDAVLQRRSELLETDPKFRLLQLQKSQLDRLIPAQSEAEHGHDDLMDVSQLNNYLVDLSDLFNERETILHALREKGKTESIADELGEASSEAEYLAIANLAKGTFQTFLDEVESNLEQQTKLLHRIMQENDRFVSMRDRIGRPGGSDSTLVKIEDALDELEQLQKHAREGKTFYEVVIPKLERLQQQVEEVSRRLGQERLDYEDYIRRQHLQQQKQQQQQPHDRRDRGYGSQQQQQHGSQYDQPRRSQYENHERYGNNGGGGGRASGPAAAVTRVDVGMVANLVAMDFDPDKVVAALRKYDNNFELALNDLLSF